jgi:RNA polymerase sigma factor (sigma-70 family)
VRAAVATLPSRQRAAVVLRYFNDLSVADTAEILGCAEGTVKALTSQAVANLRRSIGAETNDDLEIEHA